MREREKAPPPPSQSHTHNPPRGKSRDSINKTKYSKTSFAEIIHVQNREFFFTFFSNKINNRKSFVFVLLENVVGEILVVSRVEFDNWLLPSGSNLEY